MLKNDEISLQTNERKASKIMNERKTTHFRASKRVLTESPEYQRLTTYIEKQDPKTCIPTLSKTIFDALKA